VTLRQHLLTSALAASLALVSACGPKQHNDHVVNADASGKNADDVGSDLDMSSLVPRERAQLERLLETTLSPCADQAVTLDICLEQKRNCSACGPAARFLLERVQAGLSRSDIQRAYSMRFGSDVRSVDIADSPTRGPKNAPVTIMIWSDFECPACRRLVPMIEHIFEEHDQDVRLVHKLYPLSKKHPHAEIAARAAFAAKLQGKSWEMEKALFENQPKLSDQTINEIAEELGLDMKKFRADAESDAAKKVIDRDVADADRSGLSGTPFILINGREFDFSLFRPEPDLEAWITMEIKLAQSKK